MTTMGDPSGASQTSPPMSDASAEADLLFMCGPLVMKCAVYRAGWLARLASQ